MMSSYVLCKISGIKKRTVLYNYSMLAPYSIVFTAHSIFCIVAILQWRRNP